MSASWLARWLSTRSLEIRSVATMSWYDAARSGSRTTRIPSLSASSAMTCKYSRLLRPFVSLNTFCIFLSYFSLFCRRCYCCCCCRRFLQTLPPSPSTTSLENPKMSRNLTAVKELSGKCLGNIRKFPSGQPGYYNYNQAYWCYYYTCCCYCSHLNLTVQFFICYT